jgi:hypothetical protein
MMFEEPVDYKSGSGVRVWGWGRVGWEVITKVPKT